MTSPHLPALLAALEERPRCESDAFAFWLGLDPRQENPWNIEGVFGQFPAFRADIQAAGIRVTGRSMEGFTYHAPAQAPPKDR